MGLEVVELPFAFSLVLLGTINLVSSKVVVVTHFYLKKWWI
jgi:hypothetical protein